MVELTKERSYTGPVDIIKDLCKGNMTTLKTKVE